ncbi:MAG: hypothetical protein Q7R90_01595 [bacterium]|nr:hypothetical protein [bacterium]
MPPQVSQSPPQPMPDHQVVSQQSTPPSKSPKSRWIAIITILIMLGVGGIIYASLTSGGSETERYEALQNDPEYQNDRLRGFMSQLMSALAGYHGQNDTYPTKLESLVPDYLPADLYAVMPINEFKYAALGSDCNGYHLGVRLSRQDPGAAHASAASVICPGSNPDFSATDPFFYDVVK